MNVPRGIGVGPILSAVKKRRDKDAPQKKPKKGKRGKTASKALGTFGVEEAQTVTCGGSGKTNRRLLGGHWIFYR